MLDRHIAFLAALREAGLPVSLAEGLDAARAMTAIRLIDREALRTAYAATVVKRQAHRRVFDELFDLWFPPASGDGAEQAPSGEPPKVRRVEVTGGRGSPPEIHAMREELAELLADADESGMRLLARRAVAAFGRGPDSAAWSPNAVLTLLTPRTLMAGACSGAVRATRSVSRWHGARTARASRRSNAW